MQVMLEVDEVDIVASEQTDAVDDETDDVEVRIDVMLQLVDLDDEVDDLLHHDDVELDDYL